VADGEAMPEIDLSALSGPELRRLLKVAHARHNGALADRLEWEIAARAGGGHGAPAPPPHPHPDEPDEPTFRMRAPEPEPEPEPFVMARRPEPPAPAGRGLLLVGVGVVAGVVLSGAAFWGLQRLNAPPPAPRAMIVRPVEAPRAAPRPAPAPAAPGADQVAAALAPGPFPPRPEPVAPAPVPIPPPVAPPPAPVEAVAPAPKPPAEAPQAPETTVIAKQETAKAAVAKKEAALKKDAAAKKEAAAKAERAPRAPPPPVRLAKAEPAPPKAAPPRDACQRATPADRLVCADLGLRLMDVELKEAYIRALNARADPVALGQDQAAWRRARDQVSDPDRLERLYDQRIRELDAVATAARTGRAPE
jgi:uncharacterized protein YecT (DUF1311 family)